MEKKKVIKPKTNNNKFKEKYFDFYDDIKHESKSKDIEW